MKYASMKWCVLLLPAFIACSSSKQFIQLTNDHGTTKIIRAPSSACYGVVIDSLNVDSSQYRIFNFKNGKDGSVDASFSWSVSAIDTMYQSITFRNCRYDTLQVVLKRDQIRYLVRGSASPTLAAGKAMADVVIIPAFFFGTVAAVWGIVSLPIASTPWQDDLKMIGRGAGLLGIFGIAVIILNEPAGELSGKEKYKIDSLH